MRHEGKLTEWNDAKGFGFITPAAGGPRVFVHISAFPRDGRRPQVNEPITYHLTHDSQNRPKAQKAGYLKAARHSPPRSRGLMLACAIAAAFFALLAALSALGHMPMQLIAAYALHLRHVRHRQSRSREGQKAHSRSHVALRRLDRWLARRAGSAAAVSAQNQKAAVSGDILVWGGGELWGGWVAGLFG